MANEEHLKILKQGVEAWNSWRAENPDVVPDLEEADFSQVDLTADNRSFASRATTPGLAYVAVTVLLLVFVVFLSGCVLPIPTATPSPIAPSISTPGLASAGEKAVAPSCEAAEALLKKGEYVAAIEAYDEVRKANPDAPCAGDGPKKVAEKYCAVLQELVAEGRAGEVDQFVRTKRPSSTEFDCSKQVSPWETLGKLWNRDLAPALPWILAIVILAILSRLFAERQRPSLDIEKFALGTLKLDPDPGAGLVAQVAVYLKQMEETAKPTTFALITGPVEALPLPAELTSLSTLPKDFGALWGLFLKLLPQRVIALSGSLVHDPVRGAGLSLRLADLRNNRICNAVILWQSDFRHALGPTAEIPQGETYLRLVEPAAIWAYFALNKYLRRAQQEEADRDLRRVFGTDNWRSYAAYQLSQAPKLTENAPEALLRDALAPDELNRFALLDLANCCLRENPAKGSVSATTEHLVELGEEAFVEASAQKNALGIVYLKEVIRLSKLQEPNSDDDPPRVYANYRLGLYHVYRFINDECKTCTESDKQAGSTSCKQCRVCLERGKQYLAEAYRAAEPGALRVLRDTADAIAVFAADLREVKAQVEQLADPENPGGWRLPRELENQSATVAENLATTRERLQEADSSVAGLRVPDAATKHLEAAEEHARGAAKALKGFSDQQMPDGSAVPRNIVDPLQSSFDALTEAEQMLRSACNTTRPRSTRIPHEAVDRLAIPYCDAELLSVSGSKTERETAQRTVDRIANSASFAPRVQYNLACHYAMCWGTKEDLERSLHHLRLALEDAPELKKWAVKDPSLIAFQNSTLKPKFDKATSTPDNTTVFELPRALVRNKANMPPDGKGVVLVVVQRASAADKLLERQAFRYEAANITGAHGEPIRVKLARGTDDVTAKAFVGHLEEAVAIYILPA